MSAMLRRLFHRQPPLPPHQNKWVIKATDPYMLRIQDILLFNSYYDEHHTRILKVCRTCGQAKVESVSGTWQTKDFSV